MKHMVLTVAVLSMFVTAHASAACEVVKDGGAKSAFDGSSLSGLQVEKKSLVPLNKTFPALNVVEKAFKGEVQTCTTCASGYVTCS